MNAVWIGLALVVTCLVAWYSDFWADEVQP